MNGTKTACAMAVTLAAASFLAGQTQAEEPELADWQVSAVERTFLFPELAHGDRQVVAGSCPRQKEKRPGETGVSVNP